MITKKPLQTKKLSKDVQKNFSSPAFWPRRTSKNLLTKRKVKNKYNYQMIGMPDSPESGGEISRTLQSHWQNRPGSGFASFSPHCFRNTCSRLAESFDRVQLQFIHPSFSQSFTSKSTFLLCFFLYPYLTELALSKMVTSAPLSTFRQNSGCTKMFHAALRQTKKSWSLDSTSRLLHV